VTSKEVTFNRVAIDQYCYDIRNRDSFRVLRVLVSTDITQRGPC
jgi:hypothetical protein